MNPIQEIGPGMQAACFLTWIEHRRTRELCRRLDIELVELLSANRGLHRYLELIPRTIRFLVQRQASIIVIQSPSVVLAAVGLILRPLLRYVLIIDAHNEAVEPYLHRSLPVLALTRCVLKRADRVIVTNDHLARVVVLSGGSPLVLVDPLPRAPLTQPQQLAQLGSSPAPFRVTVISTYAGDEPFGEVLLAAADVGSDYQFSVTGNPAKLAVSVRMAIPSNVTLTGFLADDEYWRLLASSDAVVDLTTMDNCLVCGAYEAIAAGVPLVLSDNAPSRVTFAEFAEFTANRSRNIVAALKRVRARHAELVAAMPGARDQFDRRWTGQAQVVLDFMNSVKAARR